MTDNEIKKALEQKIEYCREFDENNEAIVKVSLLENALDLINRQKAEIERLEGIETDDWLVKGISAKRLEKEKIQALKGEIKRLNKEVLEYKLLVKALEKALNGTEGKR